VKGNPLRALGPDARQLAELVDQILNGTLKHDGTSQDPGCG
jgi:hypothetical protein